MTFPVERRGFYTWRARKSIENEKGNCFSALLLGAFPAPGIGGGIEFVSGARHCEERSDVAICERYKNSCLGVAKRRRMGGGCFRRNRPPTQELLYRR